MVPLFTGHYTSALAYPEMESQGVVIELFIQ
jgi:hypothetical protein